MVSWIALATATVALGSSIVMPMVLRHLGRRGLESRMRILETEWEDVFSKFKGAIGRLSREKQTARAKEETEQPDLPGMPAPEETTDHILLMKEARRRGLA